jgi:hypothetical protein
MMEMARRTVPMTHNGIARTSPASPTSKDFPVDWRAARETSSRFLGKK